MNAAKPSGHSLWNQGQNSLPRRKTKTLMKKDKYPLNPGLLPSDHSRPPVQQVTRDMYNMTNGYMPNGDYTDYDHVVRQYYSPWKDASYGYDSAAYGSQTYPYMTGQVYGGYDMTRGYSPTAASPPSYMNGTYSSSMYASTPSPYSMSQMASMTSVGSIGSSASHSPTPIKSETPTLPVSSPGASLPPSVPAAAHHTTPQPAANDYQSAVVKCEYGSPPGGGAREGGLHCSGSSGGSPTSPGGGAPTTAGAGSNGVGGIIGSNSGSISSASSPNGDPGIDVASSVANHLSHHYNIHQSSGLSSHHQHLLPVQHLHHHLQQQHHHQQEDLSQMISMYLPGSQERHEQQQKAAAAAAYMSHAQQYHAHAAAAAAVTGHQSAHEQMGAAAAAPMPLSHM